VRRDRSGGNDESMSVPRAAALGIGSMVGAGIFALLGETTRLAGSSVWLVFLAGGAIALLSGYSYGRLGGRFPSRGGPIEYLIQAYGPGLGSGAVAIFFLSAGTVGMALVAHAFGSYAARLIIGDSVAFWWPGVFSAALVVSLTLVNAAGTGLVARTELAVVAAKLAVLAAFVVAGAAALHVSTLTSHPAASTSGIFGGIAVAFFAYTGFGVITNAAADLHDPRRDLPRALFAAIGVVIVLYLAIVVAVLGNLSSAQILGAKETVLAEAARPVLGGAGFSVMAIAAMLSTASSVNANLFGVTNRAYTLAKYGELPETFERRLWHRGTEGLVLVSAAVILMATFLDLSALAGLASSAALIVYLAVNIGHLRLLGDTGASKTLVVLAVASSAAATVLFIVYAAVTDPMTLVWLGVAFAVSVAVEAVLQRRRSGHIRSQPPRL